MTDEHLKELMKESIKDWFDENSNEIVNNITLNISESIVGESYIKYDAATSYWPTLLFKFKSSDKLLKYNYSQIKIRYYKKPDDISDIDVINLKQKIKEIKEITYMQGNLRANYVDERRLFRTTVFVANKEAVINLLNIIIPIGLLNFNEKQLSYTEQNLRVKTTQTTKGIQKIKLNKMHKCTNTPMQLRSAFLQINGLEKQIKLY